MLSENSKLKEQIKVAKRAVKLEKKEIKKSSPMLNQSKQSKLEANMRTKISRAKEKFRHLSELQRNESKKSILTI